MLKASGAFKPTVPLGIGTMMWGTTWLDSKVNAGGNLSDAVVERLVKQAVDAGVTFFDTAEGYGGGTSEDRLRSTFTTLVADGRLTTLQLSSVQLVSKFLPTLWRWAEYSFISALDASNARLGIRCSPLFFIHSPVHPLPLEVWVRAAAKAFAAGKLAALGLSNFRADQVRRAHAEASKYGLPIVANQIMLNLLVFASPKLQETLAVCRELDITVIAYAPLGQGLLSAGLTAEKAKGIRLTRMTGLGYEALQPLRATVQRVAEANGKTMSQVVVNWLMCKGVVPLVGTRTEVQLQDTLGSLGWKLSEADQATLDQAALGRHTFEKPRWRRSLFVVFISLLMCAYKLSAITSRVAGWFTAPLYSHLGKHKTK